MIIHIYGRPNCQWCTAATNLLDRKGFKYAYHNLFDMEPKQAQSVLDNSGMKSVPIVNIDGTYIGGYENLEQYIRDAEERQM
jgi:glutaredoxin